MKQQWLDYERLADALSDRGLAEPGALQLILAQSSSGEGIFTEILVQENLVSAWEVGRVASEIFGLPYLPVDVYPPSPQAMEGLDKDFLVKFALVPLDRFGSLLTVAMPGIVPADILKRLVPKEDVTILPVIGNVSTNRQWLQANLPSGKPDHVEQPPPEVPEPQSKLERSEDMVPPLELDLGEAPTSKPQTVLDEVEAALESIDAALPIDDDDSWAGIFDAADQAVNLGNKPKDPKS